jgi:hypothetical protein
MKTSIILFIVGVLLIFRVLQLFAKLEKRVKKLEEKK